MVLQGLALPDLGAGTLNWPVTKVEDKDAASALKACIENGVNFFDTAEAYGFGKSETLLADCAAKANAKPIIATKFAPVPWRQSPDDVVAACRASAQRLGVEAIDLYQIHWPDIIQPLSLIGIEQRKDEVFWEGLARCYELGLAKNVGVSNYGPSILERSIDFFTKRQVPLVSNQINFSLLYRESAQKTLSLCQENDMTVLGYFPLANGLLAGRYSANALPRGVKGLTMKKYIVGGTTERGVTYPIGGATPLLETMRRIADHRGKSMPQVSLNYCIPNQP